MELLAVYGTLKRGQGNHRVLPEGSVLLGTTRLLGWVMYDLGAYPTIVPSEDKRDSVFVEVYEVPDLVSTDYLEGYPNHYDRKKVDVKLVGEVWVYFMHSVPKRARNRITSGIWE